jgi:histidyl-tRNA synthetase
MNLTNKPPKGTSDWFPDEFEIRKYIFDTWRKVCTTFGYEEYLTPIVENAEIYRAKSGEDVGGKELMIMTDRAGRELAIRPEMTPSVTRMVSRFYNDTPKPIRLFSIANYLRNEKPQRGRNREFWQLNFDIFGSESINADVETIQVGIEIMKALGADASMFTVSISDRRLLDVLVRKYLLVSDDKASSAIRILDKYEKQSNEETIAQLQEIGAQCDNFDLLPGIMSGNQDVIRELENYFGPEYEELKSILSQLEKLGYGEFITFKPGLARGFDYYDGMVFEVFDKNPENARSIFGGGRYNGLASIFGGTSFPAVGCAPGDETTKLFLESWGLLEQIPKADIIYIPILDEDMIDEVNALAVKLRAEGNNIEIGLEVQKIGKALEYADKKEIGSVVIYGQNEMKKGVYKMKNMVTGEETSFNF